MTREEAARILANVEPPDWCGGVRSDVFESYDRLVLDALAARGAFTPAPADVPADLASAIIAWNTQDVWGELERAGYVEYVGCDEWRVTPAGRAAGLK